MSADIKISSNVSSVEFGMSYGCVSCDIAEPRANVDVVKVSW